MNTTVTSLTSRAMLGRRRVLFLFILPALPLALAIVVRATTTVEPEWTSTLLSGLVLGTILPLLGVIIGTGAIGPEIDDGSIVYVLAKPISRPSIVNGKLAVGVACVAVFGAIPTLLTGLVMSGFAGGIALAFAIGALAAGIAYVALFLLLAVITRNAVIIGLIYALIWESLIGSVVPGAQTLSIQRWGLAITDQLTTEPSVNASVNPVVAIALLVIVTVGAALLAGDRLRSLTLNEAE